jgi:hypothetical protein
VTQNDKPEQRGMTYHSIHIVLMTYFCFDARHIRVHKRMETKLVTPLIGVGRISTGHSSDLSKNSSLLPNLYTYTHNLNGVLHVSKLLKPADEVGVIRKKSK